jgi:tRNA threonylcarbamoyladenosine biosynthesis protein TsaE
MTERLALRTSRPDDTRALAAAVAGALEAGDVVALTGELGAGKTCFVQGAAAALGVTGRVTSPSFLLRRDYAGRLPVLHLDVYRLDDLGEVLDLGFEEATDGTRVTFVEWGDAMRPLLPPDHLEVELRTAGLDDPDRRHATLLAHDDGWRRRLAGLEPALARWADEPARRG